MSDGFLESSLSLIGRNAPDSDRRRSLLRFGAECRHVGALEMPKKRIRISHVTSGTTLAEGPVGWGITPFEGNYYISRKYLRTRGFKPNYIPGLCVYKFLYVWLDLRLDNGEIIRNLGWLYWLPNPLFFFLWFRVGVPQHHPGLLVEEIEAPT